MLERTEDGGVGRVQLTEMRRVALGHRYENAHHTTTSKRAAHGESELTLTQQHPTQQRAPGKRDAYLAHTPLQRLQRLRGIADQEQRIRQTALARGACSAARDLDQTVRAGVDADGEYFGTQVCEPHDRRAIACPEIERNPLVAPNQLGELADVDLRDLVSNDHAHSAWDHSGNCTVAARVPSASVANRLGRWLAHP
jgi:hypothetical protein